MDIVVDSRWVQGFPPLMPRQVEVQLSEAEARDVRAAASRQDLYVRMDMPEGERVQVQSLWINPHDARKITLILAG